MRSANSPANSFDAVIVGAGFSGIYMLRKLRDELGLRVKVLEKAGGVAGTWYHNRYPGARTDSYWYTYCYAFDDGLLQDWNWNNRYPLAGEVKAYLEHVVERFDLGRDIQLNTEVKAAHFDESRTLWEITTANAERYTATYFITAAGVLHAATLPSIKGMSNFKGEAHHTSSWPEGVKLAGKRVGVIGTGATGVQVIPAIAPEVEHLTVFHRSPQYVVPAAQRPVTEEERKQVKAKYRQIWDDLYQTPTAFGFDLGTQSALSVSAEERQRRFEEAWEFGGPFYFQIGTFNDIVVDRTANEMAAEFIRGKIKSIVKDPVLAEKLTPRDLYAKRPLCASDYYETFNRDNVTLVDVKASPIAEITEHGVLTEDGKQHDVDVLIFATGFDGFTGSYTSIDIRGRGGLTLQERWRERGGSSFLGVAVAGFPNMFTVFGPYGPYGNNPPVISVEVEFIADFIRQARQSGWSTIEATMEAERQWVDKCDALVEQTLLLSVDSWITGNNVPGKRKHLMLYIEGIAEWRKTVAEIAANNYAGFRLQENAQPKRQAAN